MSTIVNIKTSNSINKNIKKYLDLLFKEANNGMALNDGGPFSAIIIKDNKIISRAHNKVISNSDPTAHAEILAIRKACKKEKSFFLKDCVLMSICEPCPMCLSAIMWAKIPKVYYYFTRKEAAKIGFSDNEIYKYLEGKKNKTRLEIVSLCKKKYKKGNNDPFSNWVTKSNKINY